MVEKKYFLPTSRGLSCTHPASEITDPRVSFLLRVVSGRLPRAVSSWVFCISKDGDFTDAQNKHPQNKYKKNPKRDP